MRESCTPAGHCEMSQRKRNDPGNSLPRNGFPGSFSSRGRTRTYDKRINSPLLYQLSYAGMIPEREN
jgi:hypothetical protein